MRDLFRAGGALGVLCGLLGACSSDATEPPSSSAKGGEAGDAGGEATGGSEGGEGGAGAGNAGTDGSGGAAGEPTGEAGSGGAGADPGTGGTGDAGGEAGTGAGGEPGGSGGRAGSGGPGGAPGGSGGSGGQAGNAGAGGSAGAGGNAPAYCARAPSPIVLDCSGECAALSTACAPCSTTDVKAYVFNATPNLDETILPPRLSMAAPACAACPTETYYSMTFSFVNQTSQGIRIKLSSPVSGGTAAPMTTDSSSDCGGPTRGSGSCLPILLQPGQSMRAGIFMGAEPPRPERQYVRVEAHDVNWNNLECNPQPL